MIIHPIHNLLNKAVIKILSNGLSKITDAKIIKNYHPDYSTDTANLFYILSEGRYMLENGTYYVMEEDNNYICSAGWNNYPFESSTALILSRMFVDPKYRRNFLVGGHILPICIGESLVNHENLWMTFNEVNEKTKKWFTKSRQQRTVPTLYKKFDYIGTKEIYYTSQHVYSFNNK